MSMSDNISDMLTRIRNGQSSSLFEVCTDFSKLKANILDILYKEGFIVGYKRVHDDNTLVVKLKYSKNASPAIKEIHRISRPGRRVYTSVREIKDFYNGLGVQILSTSKGVLSNEDAKKLNVGGEILCKVF